MKTGRTILKTASVLVLYLCLVSFSSCQKSNASTDTTAKTENLPDISSYPIVGTNQTNFYDTSTIISEPSSGSTFYGQDANHPGTTPHYVDNGDGTVTDMVTGLMWSQTTDLNGDGKINYDDKLSYHR